MDRPNYEVTEKKEYGNYERRDMPVTETIMPPAPLKPNSGNNVNNSTSEHQTYNKK